MDDWKKLRARYSSNNTYARREVLAVAQILMILKTTSLTKALKY